jgi:beta-N-acetylhexosaminidase
MRAFITGLAGSALSDEERGFLRDTQPWGLILFKRNVADAASVRRLIDDCRNAVGREAPVLIDQEGGRVQRLGPPDWPSYPPGAAFGALYDQDREKGLAAARLGARLIAADLGALGIDVDCLPLGDVPVAGADAVIGDRAYGTRPDKVAAIAAAIADGLAEGGVLPVLKHIPGHGRATVVFNAVDPLAPGTLSPLIVKDVIRDSIGFQGLLMSDDISMGALAGPLAERSAAAIAAGCDVVLHCNGEMPEMRAVASVVPELTGQAASRAATALATKRPASPIDSAASRVEFLRLLEGIWQPAEGTA